MAIPAGPRRRRHAASRCAHWAFPKPASPAQWAWAIVTVLYAACVIAAAVSEAWWLVHFDYERNGPPIPVLTALVTAPGGWLGGWFGALIVGGPLAHVLGLNGNAAIVIVWTAMGGAGLAQAWAVWRAVLARMRSAPRRR